MRHRYYLRLREYDNRLFLWCNHSLSHPWLDRILKGLTHLGSAVFTITLTLLWSSSPQGYGKGLDGTA